MLGKMGFVVLFVCLILVILGVHTLPLEECLHCGCCVNSTCDPNSAKCTNGCVDGYFGRRCYNKCPDYCKRCAQEFLSISHPDSYQICYECADGYFNGTFISNCSNPCPPNCLDGVCDKNNGICALGCSGNFKGLACNQCKNGWYQADCTQKCPDNCKSGNCLETSGTCIGSCKDGYLGGFCNKSCSEGCLNNVCARYTGTCKKGCKPGYSGNMCCIQSTNCVTCSSASTCSVCKVGFWGQLCNKQCSGDCQDNTCNMTDGNCTSCKDGFHGHLCNDKCSDTCLDSICQQFDGRCSKCTDGYFGNFCEMACSVTCANKSCNRQGGDCLYGCEQGYNGTLCDINTSPTSPRVVTSLVIGIPVGSVIVIAPLVVLGIAYWKKRKSSTTKLKDTVVLYKKSDASDTNVQDDWQPPAEDTYAYENSNDYQNVTFDSDNPQRVANLYEQLDPCTMEKNLTDDN